MTLDICGSFCANYTYFGVKNDGECYCGKSLGLGSTRADGCSMLCPGHIELNHGVSEDCGGSGRLSLFSTNGMPPIYPAVVASVGKYVHTGCYTERTTARALTGSQLVDSANMTVEVCEAFCAPTYSMFGVEYGSQCYCGNSLGAGSMVAPVSDCGMVCAANATEFCVGGNRLNLYTYNK